MRQPSGTRFSTTVRSASSPSAVTRIRSSDGSSFVLPIVKRITSNEALCRMTVSKMPLSRPESIRCPDASTTSEATARLSHAVVADHDERDVVARRLTLAERAHVAEQTFEKLRRRFRADRTVSFDGGEQPIVHVFLACRIHRFGDAIAEGHQEITGMQLKAFLF